MDSEKTLLQQIREKEEDLGRQVEHARTEAEAMVAAARDEAKDLICTAEKAGTVSAEQVYWKERGRTETEIAELKRAAELSRDTIASQAEKNLPAAVDRIVRYVTME